MTLFGIDISNNNGPDIDMAQVKAEGFDFVFAKVTEGDYFVDSTWPVYRDAARAEGLLVAGYHYLRGDCDINAQADLFTSHLGDGVAAMVDFEANSGDISTFWAFVNAVNARGHQIQLSYIPRWYWQQIGCPDLTAAPGLIQSSYVTGTGYAAELYPGDDTDFWNGFGGRNPDLLQFTDKADVAGHAVDANAFRGTHAELAALLGCHDFPSPTTPGDHPMALTDDQWTDLYTKVCDIWDQLRGPNAQGWPQLGQNALGQNRTPVDALAHLLGTDTPTPTPVTPASGIPVASTTDAKAA
ncbi:glycoside hydrolase family 25 protein [Nocardia terpenica]|uniref:Lysozyme n=1 Tax=Nocardia terpenica TaxID=455432 RepID=A0A164H1C1_9NOCA|nr:glycoside hydrolase family 25 protein [Nocardia terpenica]KZM68119.1 hypothetical protein AWN90_09260 [Nocardia terpenica]